ncbi:hypothetical protein PMZ80_010226 [Knufia obscura]|uniref:Uncharacterized protein n=1 Tax=Knufia obscura TaxID=1635080 RepID=A0ABR0RAE4_9EURO|nr:hypothetical protein PMZ80_010226 [Knufia obscura]
MFTKAKPTRILISQLTHTTARPLPRTRTLLPHSQPHSQTRPLASTPSLLSNPVVSETVVDQTKQNNSPNGDKKGKHEHAASSARTDVGRNSPAGDGTTESTDEGGVGSTDESHPAKQPDPQKTPERSTGFETEGPDGHKAGDGEDTGGVHKEGGGPGPHQEWEGKGKPAT